MSYSSSAVQAFSNLSTHITAVGRAMDDFQREAANLSKYVQSKPALQSVDTMAGPRIHDAMVTDTFVQTVGEAFQRADRSRGPGRIFVDDGNLGSLIAQVERQDARNLADQYLHNGDYPHLSPAMLQYLSLHEHEPDFAATFLNTLSDAKVPAYDPSPLKLFLTQNNAGKDVIAQIVADGYAGGLNSGANHTITYFLVVPEAGTSNDLRGAILRDIAGEKTAAVDFTKFLDATAIHGLVTGAGGTMPGFFDVLKSASSVMSQDDLRWLLGQMGSKGAMPQLALPELKATIPQLGDWLRTAMGRLSALNGYPVSGDKWATALGMDLGLANPLVKWIQTTAESDNVSSEHVHALAVTLLLVLGSTYAPEAAAAAAGEKAWEALVAGGVFEAEPRLNKDLIHWPTADAEGMATDFQAELNSSTMWLAIKAMYDKGLVTDANGHPESWSQLQNTDDYVKFMQRYSADDHRNIDPALSQFLNERHIKGTSFTLQDRMAEVIFGSQEAERLVPGGHRGGG